MPVYTFHKLSLEILKDKNISYEIAEADLLENIIHEFFQETILESDNHMKLVLNYFNYRVYKDIKNNYKKFQKSVDKIIIL